MASFAPCTRSTHGSKCRRGVGAGLPEDTATEMEDLYIWKHVRGYLSTGAQNPIRYVNC
jgi:hypothetical protein